MKKDKPAKTPVYEMDGDTFISRDAGQNARLVALARRRKVKLSKLLEDILLAK